MGSGPTLRGRLPLLYFAFAHLFLAAAMVALVASSDSFVGFFYHPANSR